MKNIQTYLPITLIALTLTSCLEQLDIVPQSFEKVYGSEGTTEVLGMIRRNNGHLLLFGAEVKPAFKDGSDVSLPFILETDEFGNEVRYRNYGFFEGKFDMQLTSWDEAEGSNFYGTNEFVTLDFFNRLIGVKELSNGSFFCLGRFVFSPKNSNFTGVGIENDHFYLLLDEILEPIKWGLFNDTELEGPGRFWHILNEQVDIIELPTGDIIFNSNGYLDFDYSDRPSGFAIYKFSPLTEIIDIWRYPSGNLDLAWQARSFVLAHDGSSLVVTVNQFPRGMSNIGGPFASFAETSLFRIDLSSGEVLKTVKYNTHGISFDLAHSENGYVGKVYHPDPEDSIAVTDRQWWGSLLFVNENLDFLDLKHITETNDILRSVFSIIQTADGGYVAEFQKNVRNGLKAVLIKTYPDGEVQWRYEEEENTQITDIVEMDDGGIAYTVLRDYNGIGRRVTLVKLTADGKL